MKNDWWFKFEYSKWDDPSLQLCRMETQGLWLRIYIALRKSGRSSITATVEKFSALAGCTVPEVVRSISEIQSFDVADVTLCNAQNVTRNSLVTLESRSLKRELSGKEKTRLRVKKHRGNAGVTPDVTVQSKSKKKSKKKKEEKSTAKTPPDPRKDHPAICLVHELTTLWPRKDLWDRIIRELGSDPDKQFFRESYEVWLSVNGNPMNLQKWLLGPNATKQLPEIYGVNQANNGTRKPTSLDRIESTKRVIDKYPTEAELAALTREN